MGYSIKKTAAKRYMKRVYEILKKIEVTQIGKIREAAEIISESIIDGGVLHTFGTSHSQLVAQEVFERAGGLAAVDNIGEYSVMKSSGISGRVERLEGYASILLDYHGVSKGDVIIVVSNSGRNAAPVEAALEAKKRGLKVIAITSLAHTKMFPSRHSSGKRLFEVADIVIDNCGVAGDAVLGIEGLKAKIAPTSTVAGTFIINAIMAQVAQKMMSKGVEPPMLISYTGSPDASTDDVKKHNLKQLSKYSSKIVHYFQFRS